MTAFTDTQRFFAWLVVWLAAIAAQALMSQYVDKAAVSWQITRGMRAHQFLEWWANPDHWSAIFIFSATAAWICAIYQPLWRSDYDLTLWSIGAVVAVIFQIGMCLDSSSKGSGNWSALAINGWPTWASGLHMIYLAWGVKIAISFFLQTPLDQVWWLSALAITLLLAVHLGIGIIGPPWKVNGDVHEVAWATAGTVWFFLLLGFLRLVGLIKFNLIA